MALTKYDFIIFLKFHIGRNFLKFLFIYHFFFFFRETANHRTEDSGSSQTCCCCSASYVRIDGSLYLPPHLPRLLDTLLPGCTVCL